MANGEKDKDTSLRHVSDLKGEILKLEKMLADLKVAYEQFFLGILPLPPDKLHFETRQLIKRLRKAPFRNSAARFQLASLEHRYSSYRTYWERILREKDEGIYSRDLFKAELRKQHLKEAKLAQSKKGVAEKGIMDLFQSYKGALEKSSSKPVALDYTAFKNSLLQRTNEFKGQTGAKRLSFKVLNKNGRVVLQVKAKS